MKANISGVNLYVMAYAWSQQRSCRIVSTCGKTITHRISYESKYADHFDNTAFNELPRPAILHQLFHFLPLVDEANKERQNALALEKKILTKNCWTRLITTLLGQSVLDLMRWDRYMRCQNPIGYTLASKDFGITGMADLIARSLEDDVDQARRRNHRTLAEMLEEDGPLVRIRGEDNSIHHPSSHIARTKRCFICRRYKKQAPNTVWECARCGMPLCFLDRNRNETCLKEHQCSSDPHLGCRLMPRRNQWVMPRHHKIFLRTRTGKKR